MELFLNLCWLSLLLPAFLIWRRGAYCVSGGTSLQDRRRQLLVISGVLGCVLVLLFPVISATDDLHAMRPEMEESERAFGDAGKSTGAIQTMVHAAQSALPANTDLTPIFEPVGTAPALASLSFTTVLVPSPAGRAPPIALAAVL